MSNGTEALRQELAGLIEKADADTLRLARAFDTLAGNLGASPLAVWGAAAGMALIAIRVLEDQDASGTGFSKKVAADLKALFIAKLMTRDKDGR
jgi:hypothetical protein